MPNTPHRGCFAVFLVFLGLLAVLLMLAVVGQVAGTTEGVALIRIEGPIYQSRDLLESIRRARESKRAKAVLVRIDSPGGAVGASEEIFRELVRTRAEKPVVVSMGNVAASGGYYVALAANEIYANAGSITGSIGVIATDLDLAELLQTLRIRPNVIKSGEHKDTGSPLRQMTEEERNLLQRLVYDLHRQFVREVVRSRHKTIEKALVRQPRAFDEILATSETKQREKAIELSAFESSKMAAELGIDEEIVDRVKVIADGRVFTGEQALALGLVDALGNLEDARRRATSLANLLEKAPLIDYSPKKTIVDALEKFMGQSKGLLFHELPTLH